MTLYAIKFGVGFAGCDTTEIVDCVDEDEAEQWGWQAAEAMIDVEVTLACPQCESPIEHCYCEEME